jgi:hypothetical protein
LSAIQLRQLLDESPRDALNPQCKISNQLCYAPYARLELQQNAAPMMMLKNADAMLHYHHDAEVPI